MNKGNQFDEGPHDIEEGIQEGQEEGERDGRQALSMIKETTMIEYVAGGLSAVSVSLAIATMFLTGGFVINGAGVCAILLGPYSYWQQRNITDVKALKETHEALVKEVDILRSENERLKGLVDELGTSVDKLEDMENTFDYINEMNIESVEDFREQVKEGKTILGMMRKNLKASAFQNVITVVLHSDVDGNYVFNDNEVEKLVENLKAINGLEMNEKRFRSLIAENESSVDAVVKILSDVVLRNKDGANEIFRISDRSLEQNP